MFPLGVGDLRGAIHWLRRADGDYRGNHATSAELSASIAHELNRPLMSIIANAQAAKKWLTAASPNVVQVNSSIERILRDARAADETMQHIRALFKQEQFDKREAQIHIALRTEVPSSSPLIT
jgi:signal transduction histidine kinase